MGLLIDFIRILYLIKNVYIDENKQYCYYLEDILTVSILKSVGALVKTSIV